MDIGRRTTGAYKCRRFASGKCFWLLSTWFIFTFELYFRWWKETRENAAEEVEGVLYSAKSVDADDTQILIVLHGENKSENEEGFLGRGFALVREGTWLQALRW